MKSNLKNLLSAFSLIFISALLFASSNPGIVSVKGIGLLIFTAFVPVLYLIKNFSFKICLLSGFLFGFISFFMISWWLVKFGILALIFVISLCGILYALLFILLKIVYLKAGSLSFFLIPLVFCVFDVFRSIGFLGFSYGVAGYTQWKNPFFLKIASYTGIYGVSFIIYAFNSVIADFLGNTKKIFKKADIAFIAFIICFSLLLYFVPYSSGNDKINVNVTMIQNFSSKDSDDVEDYKNDLKLLKDLTLNSLQENENPDLIVWPETAIVPDIIYNLKRQNHSERKKICQDLSDFIQDSKNTFVIGNNRYDFSDSDKGYYNSALVLSGKEGVLAVQSYDKNHLVPFTEYIPDFVKISFLNKLMKYVPSDDYTPGKRVKIFELKTKNEGIIVRFGVLICFEDSFPELAGKMRQMGADFLVNITNDSWAESLSAQNMHLSMSVFRAVENHVPVIRSSISGQTCIISSTGQITKISLPFKDTFLNGNIEIFK